MNNTLLQLNICQGAVTGNSPVNKGEERIKQYVAGFNKLFEYPLKGKVDVLVCDNSTQHLDERIAEVLPPDCKYVLSENNKGTVNKGSGLLHQWQMCSATMEEYEWIVYFEPRQLLKDFKFFDSFFGNPRNLFNVRGNQFWTGIFSIESKLLMPFTHNRTLKPQESIEYALFDYMSPYEYDHEEVNLLWHDAASNQWFELHEI